MVEPQIAKEMPRSRPVKSALTVENVAGRIIAPPTPCRRRAAINVVPEYDMAAKTLATPKVRMPRISAPTVAQHRMRQRDALLHAATELLVSGGLSAVTPAAVGAAAGLARPSVYQYFSSGAQRPAAALAAAQLPSECLGRLWELRREQAAPFMDALQALAVPELQLTAQLLGVVLEAAMGAVESGSSLAAVTDLTLALVRSAVSYGAGT